MLNDLVEIVEKETAKGPVENLSPPDKIANGTHGGQVNGAKKEPVLTWIHKNFQVSLNANFGPASSDDLPLVSMPRTFRW